MGFVLVVISGEQRISNLVQIIVTVIAKWIRVADLTVIDYKVRGGLTQEDP